MTPTPPILIVDDDEYIREMLCLFFQTKGIHNVEAVADGRSGLALLRASKEPHVVFVDLMMPGFSGWDFLRQVEAEPVLRGHKIAVMSASRPKREDLGAYPFFQKPPEIQALIDFASKI